MPRNPWPWRTTWTPTNWKQLASSSASSASPATGAAGRCALRSTRTSSSRTKGSPPAPAKRVCASCEVRAECLQDALDRGERFGVWGGLSERERRVLAGQPNPIRHCPAHGVTLSGGPVLYHCPVGRLGHAVTTAGLDQPAEAGNDAA